MEVLSVLFKLQNLAYTVDLLDNHIQLQQQIQIQIITTLTLEYIQVIQRGHNRWNQNISASPTVTY